MGGEDRLLQQAIEASMMDSNINGVNPPVSNTGTEDEQEDGGQRAAVEDDLTVALRLSQQQEMERQERMRLEEEEIMRQVLELSLKEK